MSNDRHKDKVRGKLRVRDRVWSTIRGRSRVRFRGRGRSRFRGSWGKCSHRVTYRSICRDRHWFGVGVGIMVWVLVGERVGVGEGYVVG